MIFNSYHFVAFFITFFVLYWFVFNKSLKLQNLLLLAGSYFFYGLADWRFLVLLIAISGLNFYLGKKIEKSKSEKSKKILLYIGIVQGIGGLAFFKYFNFFIDSIKSILAKINVVNNLQTLDIIVPLGISFFTFRTVSYLLDVEKEKIKATTNWIVFFNYVAFFPSLLSGPIDKAKLLVPQLEQNRNFDYENAVLGMRQILWGFFKKLVIANNCAVITNEVFKNYETQSASTLLIGSLLFTIQIYTDFSGYSDMAIGFSRLIGFKITKNFNYPFFGQNISEFWTRWHISLTSWLTEYVYMPLSISFRDLGNFGGILAVIINFCIVGLWHGANWTYLLFGFLNGCFYIPILLKNKKVKKIDPNKTFPSGTELFNMIKTFLLITAALVLFKSRDIASAFGFYKSLFSFSIIKFPEIALPKLLICLLFSAILLVTEWNNRTQDFGLNLIKTDNVYKRWGIYFGILTAIVFFGIFTENQFIYFQF